MTNYMNTNETESMKNMENKDNNNMDEKVHYEIKFVETEEGYRLEATGDKKALNRLGIGPNMVGRKRRGGHRGRKDWARARHARKAGPRRRRRAAAIGHQPEGMRGHYRFAQGPRLDEFGSARGLRHRSRRMHGPHAGHGYGQPLEKNRPDFGQTTWEW